MHPAVRAMVLGVCLTALASGCSKPLEPDARSSSSDVVLGGSPWNSPTAPEPQTARARLRFVADVVTIDAGFGTRLKRNEVFLVDSDGTPPGPGSPFPAVPASAVLKQVRWRVDGTQGPEFVVDNAPDYTTGGSIPPLPAPGEPFPPGVWLIHLTIPERAGGGALDVGFEANLAPEMWWSGPEPALFPPASDGDGRGVDVTDWAAFTTSPAWPPDGRGYFGPDSFQFVPSRRLPVALDLDRRTFYEIWGDRIYARTEGDAVHLGSWVVFSTGGFDADSPYTPIVGTGSPSVPPGYETQPDLYALLIEQGLIGSPIGARVRVPVRLPNGQLTQPASSTTHPNFDTFSVFYSPVVASYWRMISPGKAYAIVEPVDGHGKVGRTTEDLVALADRVDAGGGSAEDQLLRRRVLTFQVRDDPAGGANAHAANGGTSRLRRQ